MNKKIKLVLGILLAGLLIAGVAGYYMFNMPKRDVQGTKADFNLKAADIVNEYLKDPLLANEKYLDTEGESKILNIQGVISSIEEDYNNQVVIKLKNSDDKAAVSATLLPEVKLADVTYKVGEEITVKGVIRSGASYDSDLGMYEDVIMEKCSFVKP